MQPALKGVRSVVGSCSEDKGEKAEEVVREASGGSGEGSEAIEQDASFEQETAQEFQVIMLFTVKWVEVVLSNQGVEEIKELKGELVKELILTKGYKG